MKILFLLLWSTAIAYSAQQPLIAPCDRGYGWNGACSQRRSSCLVGGADSSCASGKCIVDKQGTRSCAECPPQEQMKPNGVCACFKGHDRVAGRCGIMDSPCRQEGIDLGCESGKCLDVSGYKRCLVKCPSGRYMTKDFLCCLPHEVSNDHGSCREPSKQKLAPPTAEQKSLRDDETAEILAEEELNESLARVVVGES